MAGSVVSPAQKRGPQPWWATIPEEELLRLRLKDLALTVQGTWLDPCLRALNRELKAKGLITAHGWLSEEWFSPHASPGIAFPFYLAHPRLARIERKMILDVEGGTVRECMRYLRHEAGHVVQYAYRLHRRRAWQNLFGQASKPYPDYYRPNPASKNYVQHLRRWYAQCHADEDFAETFAVWLTPRSNWRKRYADWPALKKLLYVDELMKEIKGQTPLSAKRVEVDPISKLSMTLGEHYELKRERYSVDAPTIFDRDLQRIFSADPRYRAAPLASAFIKRNRIAIRRAVSRWTDEYELALDAAVDDMIDRSRALHLRAHAGERTMRQDVIALLTKKAVRSLYSSGRRQAFAI